MKRSETRWAVLLFVLWTIFIFSRSMQPADLSNEESGKVLSILEQLLPFELSNHMVRKAAHFIEYAVLGFLGWFAFTPQQERRLQFLFALMTCFAVSVCDEMIQLFVEGRAGRISDVCLDTAGAVAGILAGVVLRTLYRRIKQRID